MNLSSMEYFVVLARERNFTRAAEKLHITQQSLSAHIAALEKELVSALKAMLGIVAKVHLMAPKSIQRSEGKAVRVVDKRKLY